MEFGSDDLRPFSGVDRPDVNNGEGDSSSAAGAPRPLTAMSTEERQFSEAVRPMTGGGGAAGGRPQTGMRPPSGFVVANAAAAAAAVPGRPKTSRSRVGTAVGARQQEQQVDGRGRSGLHAVLLKMNGFSPDSFFHHRHVVLLSSPLVKRIFPLSFSSSAWTGPVRFPASAPPWATALAAPSSVAP